MNQGGPVMGSYTREQIEQVIRKVQQSGYCVMNTQVFLNELSKLDTPEQSEFVKKYSQRGVVSIYDSPPILEEFKRIEAQLIEAEIKRQIEKLRCELQDPPGHEDFKDID